MLSTNQNVPYYPYRIQVRAPKLEQLIELLLEGRNYTGTPPPPPTLGVSHTIMGQRTGVRYHPLDHYCPRPFPCRISVLSFFLNISTLVSALGPTPPYYPFPINIFFVRQLNCQQFYDSNIRLKRYQGSVHELCNTTRGGRG